MQRLNWLIGAFRHDSFSGALLAAGPMSASRRVVVMASDFTIYLVKCPWKVDKPVDKTYPNVAPQELHRFAQKHWNHSGIPLNGAERARTANPRVANAVLSQ